MTWINFLSYLGIGYAAYYLLIFLLDSRPGQSKSSNQTEVLTFSETFIPETVTLENVESSGRIFSSSPASTGLAAVSIKDLFELARKDAIEFTKSVSF